MADDDRFTLVCTNLPALEFEIEIPCGLSRKIGAFAWTLSKVVDGLGPTTLFNVTEPGFPTNVALEPDTIANACQSSATVRIVLVVTAPGVDSDPDCVIVPADESVRLGDAVLPDWMLKSPMAIPPVERLTLLPAMRPSVDKNEPVPLQPVLPALKSAFEMSDVVAVNPEVSIDAPGVIRRRLDS